MYISIICKTFLKGGAEKQALILAKSFAEKGINVCLINWYGNKVDKENLRFIENNSLRYFPLRGNFLNKLLEFQKILKKEKISITISYLTLSNFVSGISKVLQSDTVSIGGIRNEKLPYYKFLFEKLIHNYIVDATVFNNFSAKAKFEKRGFDPRKIFVIQNAIDLNSYLLESKSADRVIRIISVGRFVKQKDYDTALVSFRDLIKRNPDKAFKYTIVGYGPKEPGIRSLARRLKIDQMIDFLINPPDIPEILKNSDIFLSTSLYEGVSNSVMEAMVAGLPIVATDVGDNNYLIKNGRNGYLVPCKNIKMIVEKLESLSESEEKRKEFGRYSHTVLQAEFSRTRLLENYLNLFKELNVLHTGFE